MNQISLNIIGFIVGYILGTSVIILLTMWWFNKNK